MKCDDQAVPSKIIAGEDRHIDKLRVVAGAAMAGVSAVQVESPVMAVSQVAAYPRGVS